MYKRQVFNSVDYLSNILSVNVVIHIGKAFGPIAGQHIVQSFSVLSGLHNMPYIKIPRIKSFFPLAAAGEYIIIRVVLVCNLLKRFFAELSSLCKNFTYSVIAFVEFSTPLYRAVGKGDT